MEEYTIFNFISDVGAPIAAAVVMGGFIFIIIKKIMDDIVGNVEELQGFCKMLITRIKTMNNDVIKIDALVNDMLELEPDTDRIARSDGKIDARKD